jgi:predicted transcriptional regulator
VEPDASPSGAAPPTQPASSTEEAITAEIRTERRGIDGPSFMVVPVLVVEQLYV